MPDLSDIRHASWGGEGGGLAGLARPITDRICDDALVLPQSLREELELLLQRCRQRETLAKGLGVTMAARYRLGVRSLFVGASGTGKTLAAAWLATRLGTPLYCVDLSAVTSKYIGETEKNLATLLARAEHEDVMLLFDEADSLFGKRTDIRDANDRFANAQTNYLLQRIEEYRGIVILTSNTRNRFDAAFTRRIDMIVDFPMPGPEERRDIWLSHLGAGHGISAGEVNRISAGADLCGGHIRNVVLTAAVLASRESRTIAYGDILAGMQVEYRKLGRQLPAELSRNP
jgi:SpoVK/Ycf46/Vps4 family AAA+-type ATPase